MPRTCNDHPEWVWIEGGVAQDMSENVVVLDMDELDVDSTVTDDQIDNVQVLLERAMKVGVDGLAARCQRWLCEYAENWFRIETDEGAQFLIGPFRSEEAARTYGPENGVTVLKRQEP